MLSSYLGLAVACPSYFSKQEGSAKDEGVPGKEFEPAKADATPEQPKDGCSEQLQKEPPDRLIGAVRKLRFAHIQLVF